MARAPQEFIRQTILPLAAYGPPRDPAAVPLHLNEAPADVPRELKEALAARILEADWSKYPITDGLRLGNQLAEAAGWDGAGTLVGNGSNELLQLLLWATLEAGDAVVLGTPSFSLYALQARAIGARVVEVRLRGPDGGFRFPLEELLEAARASQARLVLLASPNNPTGTLLPREDLMALLSGTDALVAVDEAYHEFSGQQFAPLLHHHPRLVLLRTFSKAMAGAALRCGSLFGSPALVKELRKVQLPYNLSMMTCLVASALAAQPRVVAERCAQVRAERERLSVAIAARGARVHPSGANFLLFEQARRPAKELHAALFARGVLIRDQSGHPELPEALRVSVGAPAANDAFLAALEAELP